MGAKRLGWRGWAAFMAIAMATWAGTGCLAAAQVLDCTVSGELADMPGTVRFPGEYHLWNLGFREKTAIEPAVWKGANDRVAKGEDVWLDIEPDLVDRVEWRRPINLAKASREEVKATVTMLARELAPLCERAKWTGAEVWTYRLISDNQARGEVLANKPDEYAANVKAFAELEYAPGRTLAADLASTGGGELYECYVPSQWNVNKSWALAKCILLVERQAAALEDCGVRGIPLLYPFTVGGAKSEPVRPEIMQAMLFVAKQRGRYAIWNGWGEYSEAGKKLPKITAEMKRWLK